jgi:hypothetical protein
MVRLVFRPYTQIRRSICTSEPLRASTRVSSGFALFTHSSPSFGSQRLRSCSNPSGDPGDRPMVRQKAPTCYRFRYAQGFGTRALAQTLDSLVRVSRRVAYCHYASTLARRRGPRPGQAASGPGLQHPEGLNSRGPSAAAQADAGPPAREYAVPKADGTLAGEF